MVVAEKYVLRKRVTSALGSLEVVDYAQSTGGSLSPLRLLYGVLCLGGFQLAVSHIAPTGELLTAPSFGGKVQHSLRLRAYQYGVGVDLH